MWTTSRWLIPPLVNSDVVSMFDLPKVRSRLPETQLPAMDSGPSVFTAIRQFGLRLQARKTPVDVLVIDHVEKPAAN